MCKQVILTFTTIPSRLNDTKYGYNGIKSNLDSIVNQTYENYEIHFNIPYTLSLIHI